MPGLDPAVRKSRQEGDLLILLLIGSLWTELTVMQHKGGNPVGWAGQTSVLVFDLQYDWDGSFFSYEIINSFYIG